MADVTELFEAVRGRDAASSRHRFVRVSGPTPRRPCRFRTIHVTAASAGLLAATLSSLTTPLVSADTAESPQSAAYVKLIKPLLATRCGACHGALSQAADLRVDTAGLMATGGSSGPAIVPGEPALSLLLSRVSHADPAERMPPTGEGEPLSAAEIAAIAAWIAAGCPAPADEAPEADPRDHWAFRPRTRPVVPRGRSGEPVHPIDAFLQAELARAGLRPQPAAPRHVLIRRLHIDLVGMPPQPEELARAIADTSDDWYERLVDTLLADPRHGERWGRHWMDVWRYSDWWGHNEQHRYSQKHMWHFRDWIVESLNDDVGYDQMVRLMLAADEEHPDDLAKLRATGFLARNWFLFNRTPWLDDTVEHVCKSLLGLTMNCAKCHDHKYDPIRQQDYYRLRAFFEPIETRVDVVPGESDVARNGIPRVFDGHLDAPTFLLIRGDDSKPVSSQPLAPGIPEVLAFEAIDIASLPLPVTAYEPQRRPWVFDAHLATADRAVTAAERARERSPSASRDQAVLAAKAQRDAVEKRVAATRAAWAAGPVGNSSAALDAARIAAKAEKEAELAQAWAEVAALSEKLAQTALDDRSPTALASIEKSLAVARQAVDATTKAVANPGTNFTPCVGAQWTATRFKHSGHDDPVVPFPPRSTGRRTALARWITDPRHPLTARVAANHIWMRHLGKPLVSTVFDFGRKGEPPTHPELLDWLASELVQGPSGGHGWSMKHLHRLICTSAAYRRMSSTAGGEAAMSIDPDNRLLWRREPTRLEAQVVRDSLLALAGTLDPTMGGPPVAAEDQAGSRRRSLYFWHSDMSRNLFLRAFDDAQVSECYRRDQSIVPQQALALSNASLVHDSAAGIAARVEKAVGTASDDLFVTAAFVTILQREPTFDERRACSVALERWRGLPSPPAARLEPARVNLTWALLNHNDFLTLR